MSERVVTLSELRAHNTKNELWILLHEKVYDVSEFLNGHPGGDEIILAEFGHDATEAFEDVGHSDEARKFLPGMFVGVFQNHGIPVIPDPVVQHGSCIIYWAPLGLLTAWLGYRFYTTGAPF
ncbi:cytochrome b5 [Mycena vitilis]|nr:cytochrome b5 [Mycena vitilis]